MSIKGISIINVPMVLMALFLILSGCSIFTGDEKIISDLESTNAINKISIEPLVSNPPSDNELEGMIKEANTVMEEVLGILEKGKCYNYLTNDINENAETLETWIKKTKPSHNKIGLLLRSHPNIFCISLIIQNYPIKENAVRIRKNFKQFNMMWVVPSNSSDCLIIAFPTESLVSFYGSVTASENDSSLNVYIENIAKYYPYLIKTGQYPNFTEKIKIEPNDKSLMKTIIESYSLSKLDGEGSKGLLLTFTKKVRHRGRRFWADGIRIYATYNYDASFDRDPQPKCPQDYYGNAYCVCATFPLQED